MIVCPLGTKIFPFALPVIIFLAVGLSTLQAQAVTDAPSLRCTPEDTYPGQTIIVSGSGYAPGQSIEALWDGTTVPWGATGPTVEDDGTFTLSLAAPSDSYALHTLGAIDGRGGRADCYINLQPRNPTPTATATATPTAQPTPTATPGPPPGVTVTPTAIPAPDDYCAAFEAVFSRDPLEGSTVATGVEATNVGQAWPEGRLEVGVRQYQNLLESDTGARGVLPALGTGETTTLPLTFAAPAPGEAWYRLVLIDTQTGQISRCASDWWPLQILDAEPYPPPLVAPLDGVWLDTRRVELRWAEAEIPPRGGAVEAYQVQLSETEYGMELLNLTTWPDDFDLTVDLNRDYPQGGLFWRVRAKNSAGWGKWTTPAGFGADTARPGVTFSYMGEVGDEGWYVSPLSVRTEGSDANSGLMAVYLQAGDTDWEQVIPGREVTVTEEGEYDLRAYGRDYALNRSLVTALPVKVDMTPPDNLGVVIAQSPTASGWYTAPLTVSVGADDLVSGVTDRLVRVDGGNWFSGVPWVETGGDHLIEYMARDAAGNETEVGQTTVRLDLTPPEVSLTLTNGLCRVCEPAQLVVSVSDSRSGVTAWTLVLSDTVLASGDAPGGEIPVDGHNFSTGPLTFHLAVQDAAGWVAERELTAVNGGGDPGPVTTPTAIATTTPAPRPTTTVQVPSSYATATPAPTPSDDDGGSSTGSSSSDGGAQSGSNIYNAPAVNYSVGGTAVPVILPVTGGVGRK